jgi:hypothetical protein
MFGPAKGADLNLKLRPIFQSGLIKTIKLSKPIPQALAHHTRGFEVIRRALRVRFETGRGPLGVLFGTDERPEEWALRLLRWKPKPLITRLAKGFETDSKCPSGEFLNQVNQL